MSITGLVCDIAYGIASRSVYGLTNVLLSGYNEDEEKLYIDIIKNDVENSSNIIATFIEEKQWDMSDAVKKHIEQMYSLCKQLTSDLNEVKKKRDYNNSLILMKGMRKYNIRELMLNIIQNHQVLRNRLTILEQISAISTSLPSSDKKEVTDDVVELP